MHATRPPLFVSDDRHRVTAEEAIVELIVLYGYVLDVRRGATAHAQREAGATLERWIGLGLPFARGTDGSRRFDPVEAVNFGKYAGCVLGDPYLPERALRQSRTLVLAFHDGSPSHDTPPAPSTLRPQRFAVTLRREFNLPKRERGTPIVLRLPLPIEDAALRDLEVDFLGPHDASTTATPGRLDLRMPHPGTPTLEAGVRVSFVSHPSRDSHARDRLDPADAELYTRANEGLVKISERVLALAERLAGRERDPLATLQHFVDYVTDEITLGSTNYDRLDPAAPLDTALDTRWCDCQLASALIVALCRARGIPARLVSGYLLLPPTPAGHFWIEAWIDDQGWLPFDTTAADLSAQGRDSRWRDYFFGRLDHRMKTQVLPRLFNIAPSVRFPASWHTLPRLDGDGFTQTTIDSATGALVFRDSVVAQRGDAPPGSLDAPSREESVNATPL